MTTTRVLTGITTTGTPHLGNYVGAIRPAIEASRRANVQSFFFLADYHALIKCDDPQRIERSRLELAATWLACGLDPELVTFYRQSDVPEVLELTWLLTCVCPKGMMNRAHAYKAACDANATAGEDLDAGVTMGLFSYPVLMAADILMFNAHLVPVGRDQVQHIEMTRDLAQRFNHVFGGGRHFFVLPEAVVEEQVATLPGLDGRKMSKSYDNTIPLFEGGTKALGDAIARIVTDSRLPGEPKDPDTAHLVTLYEAFAEPAQVANFRSELQAGLGWGDAKQRLFNLVEAELAPMRARYAEFMAHPDRLEDLLMAGSDKARGLAQPFMAELRQAVGLRRMLALKRAPHADSDGEQAGRSKLARPSFKQYREADGLFYFKFIGPDDRVLLQSHGFAQGKESGAWVQKLKLEGGAVLAGAPVVLTDGVKLEDVLEALSALASA
ncbi:MAG: tryptophan--tRNA ligase [Burkholderiales bacterium]|nr:tryptophan--tRNA ligase [Burkholderiales bacterium]